MKKTIYGLMVLLISLAAVSCGGSPKTNTEAELLADFDANGFAAAGITEYFNNPEGTDEATFEASFASSRSSADNGTASIKAAFTDYPYGDYTVTGDFIYTLPVQSGKILGYRVETSEDSSPVFKNTTGTETAFSITMDEAALAPAGGDYDATANTVSNGIAFPMLSGTDASFTVGSVSVGLDDIPVTEEPYSKNMIAEDLYSLMMANGPISGYAMRLIQEQSVSSGQSSGTITVDLGNGNTYSVTYDEQSSQTEMKIINPMDFVMTDSAGRTYSVHTNGKVNLNASGFKSVAGGSGDVTYQDFVSTIIITGGTEPKTYTSRKINGSYSMNLASPGIVDGSIKIGNNTYRGDSYKELLAFYALDMTISQFWHLGKISDDGTYINTLGGTEDAPLIVEGKYNKSAGLLDGEIRAYGTTYPFRAEVKLAQREEITTGTFLSLTFNNITFTPEEISYINAIYELSYSLMNMFM